MHCSTVIVRRLVRNPQPTVFRSFVRKLLIISETPAQYSTLGLFIEPGMLLFSPRALDRLCPAALAEEQMQHARSVWQRDKQKRTPLMLPHRLARKYPEYRFNRGWAWLFPARYTCRQSLHHKWLNRRSLSALHGSLAGPTPGLRRLCTRQIPAPKATLLTP
jgi:hypothetical protein